MLEELKNTNYSSEKGDVLFFLTEIIGRKSINKRDIKKICEHTPGRINFNIEAIIAYCIHFNLVNISTGKIQISPILKPHIDNPVQLNTIIIKQILSKLFSQASLAAEMFSYDINKKKYVFKNEKLPLNLSIERDTLVNQGFFEIKRSINKTQFLVSSQYEQLLISFCLEKRRKITIEQLKNELDSADEAGRKAELFVIEFEKRRLAMPRLQNEIKRISDIDVGAGYDIISFDSDDSDGFDRFIEVKAISRSTSFFWSINEINVAKCKNERYHLYLVDLKRITEPTYCPLIISNPVNTILASDDWLMEAQSYLIRHI